MPPKKADATSDAPTGLSASELRFIKAVFDNMTQKPDADWNAVAGDLTLKDAKCAKERFRQMSVRHGWAQNGGASPRKAKAAPPTTGEPKVKKAPRAPRKKASVKKEEDNSDGADNIESEEVDTKMEQEEF